MGYAFPRHAGLGQEIKTKCGLKGERQAQLSKSVDGEE